MGQRGAELDSQLKLLIRRARHPGSPGTVGGVPTSEEIAAIERSILEWKRAIESALALPNAPTSASSAYIPVDAKLRAVNAFLNTLTTLTTLRIARGLGHGSSWREPYALLIPRAIMADFPGLGASAQNRLGDRFFPLVVDRGADGRADPVRLRVSETLIQGLEVGHLADDPSEASFFTMIQYLATRQLQQNLADLRYLKADRKVAVPEIPGALVSKLESMGLPGAIADEQRRAVAEPGARAALGRTYARVAPRMPSIVDAGLVTAMANVIGTNRRMRRNLQAPLQQLLTEAERDNTVAALEEEIAASSLPLSALPESELLPTLRFFVANAKGNTQIAKLLQLMSDGVMQLSQEQRARLMDLIEARRRTVGEAIPADTLRDWHAAARAETEASLYTNRRTAFVEHLLLHAKSASKAVRESAAGDVIEPSIIGKVFAEELAKLAPRQSVREWLFEIARETTYAAANDKYAEIVSRVTSPRVLVGGRVNAAVVERYVERHDFRPEIRFTETVNPALAERLIQRIIDGRRNDIRNLLKVGDWFGFNRVEAPESLRVEAILPDSEKRGKYFEALGEQVLSRFPVLNVDVPVGSASMKLYDALAMLNPANESSADVLERAELLVDFALIRIESTILRNIRKVGEATDLREIEKVVTSSVMLELVLTSFPEFRESQEQFVEMLLTPSLTHQIMHKYVGWYLGAGFGSILLMHMFSSKTAESTRWFVPNLLKRMARRTGPWVDVAMRALGPLIKGYMTSAMVVILADTAYQANELYETRERRQDVDDLFHSGALGGSFVDFGELQGASSAYQITKWFFVGRVALDTALLYFPMLRGALGKLRVRLTVREFAGDLRAFETLGVKPGRWDQGELDAGLHAMRARIGLPADELAAAERAHARLTAKLRGGETWDLDAIRSENPVNPIDQRLKAILNPEGAAHE
jgi:hypothetical protein